MKKYIPLLTGIAFYTFLGLSLTGYPLCLLPALMFGLASGLASMANQS